MTDFFYPKNVCPLKSFFLMPAYSPSLQFLQLFHTAAFSVVESLREICYVLSKMLCPMLIFIQLTNHSEGAGQIIHTNQSAHPICTAVQYIYKNCAEVNISVRKYPFMYQMISLEHNNSNICWLNLNSLWIR